MIEEHDVGSRACNCPGDLGELATATQRGSIQFIATLDHLPDDLGSGTRG